MTASQLTDEISLKSRFVTNWVWWLGGYSLLVLALGAATIAPVPWQMNTVMLGPLGDNAGLAWWIWQMERGLEQGTPWLLNPQAGWPFGVDTALVPLSYLPLLRMTFVARFVGEVGAINLSLWLAFLWSALAMYALTWYVTRSHVAAMVAGLIFAFAPYRVMRSYGHIFLAETHWMPLYLLALLLLAERRTARWALLAALLFAITFLENTYYGYFTAIVTLLFAAYLAGRTLLGYANPRWDWRMARATTVAALVAAVAVLPVIVLIWQAVRLGGEGGASSASYARPYEDLVRYSARWYSYLLPSAHHPILGGQVAAFQLGQGNENFVEQTNYIGYATVALALLGSWVALRGWPSAQRWRRWAISFFVLLGLVAIWLSLGPVLKLASWEIPMPSSFLFAVMPFFRAYTRWGIVAMLAASVLAGVGVAVLVGQWHQRRQQIVVLAGVFFLLGFELASGPARVVTDVSEPPSVYQWLARQHGEATVAEYPLVDATDPLTSQYLFWQRVHRRPLFNGVTLGSKGDSYRRQALDIDDPGTAPLLAALGVEYAIVHVDLYAARPAYPGGVPRLEQVSQGFALAQDFGSTLVYRVTASP